ncbi:hypothetical protein D3C81_1000030 [compost metagenome]
MLKVIHVPGLRRQVEHFSQVDPVGEVNLDVIHGGKRVLAHFLNMPSGNTVHRVESIKRAPQPQQGRLGPRAFFACGVQGNMGIDFQLTEDQ